MNTYSRRNSRQSSGSKNMIWIVIALVVVVFFAVKLLGGSGTPKPANSDISMAVTPLDANSTVYISTNGTDQTLITTTHSFYTSDAYVLVEKG